MKTALAGNSPLAKHVKRTKAPEDSLLPKDEKKRLGADFYESRSFNAAGGDSTYMTWNDFSKEVKRIMSQEYGYDFARLWDRDRENVMHSYFEKKFEPDAVARILV